MENRAGATGQNSTDFNFGTIKLKLDINKNGALRPIARNQQLTSINSICNFYLTYLRQRFRIEPSWHANLQMVRMLRTINKTQCERVIAIKTIIKTRYKSK